MRLALDQLDKNIPFCLQSRQRVCAANGQAGALQAFRKEVETDTAEVECLRAELSAIPWIPLLGGSAVAADAAVTVHDLQGRVQVLTDKYAAALAEDAVERDRIFEGQLASKVNWHRSGGASGELLKRNAPRGARSAQLQLNCNLGE